MLVLKLKFTMFFRYVSFLDTFQKILKIHEILVKTRDRRIAPWKIAPRRIAPGKIVPR